MMPINEKTYKVLDIHDWKMKCAEIAGRIANGGIKADEVELRVRYNPDTDEYITKLVMIVPTHYRTSHERFITIAACTAPTAMLKAMNELTPMYVGEVD